jgi:caffeoyl-CoA O-methyltransferase
MVEITNPRIDEYLKALYDDPDPVRLEMEELARKRRFPIVGPLMGRLLEQLTLAVGARRVFELGSGYGYSALFFARGVGPGGVVHCTDLSAENVRLAKDFLGRAGVWDRVVFHCEEARAALARTGGTWDILYNDVDKEGYPAMIDVAYERLRPGGLFVSDNALWHGRVLEGEDDGTEATRGVREFTRRLLAHPGFFTTILPVRDGVAVALRR